MRRRTRRRVYVAAVAALVGATAPFWAPPVLSRIPLFAVDEVGVVGTRYVAPDEIVRRAEIGRGASVWDDPAAWERGVEGHPLVREASVGRVGVDRLEIRVQETEPVALVPDAGLVSVGARGRALPLDPVEAKLDLPLLPGAVVEDGRVPPGGGLGLLDALVALGKAEPEFVRHVSEVRRGDHGGLRLRLTEGQACRRVLLPAGEPVRAFRRVERALGHHAGRGPVAAADARFEGQVVLRTDADGGDAGPRVAAGRGPR